MKKNLFRVVSVFFVFIFHIGFVSAETITAMECEYTEAYKEWLKLSDKEKQKVLQPPMCKTNSNFFSLIGNSSVKESYTSTKFDLRNYNAVSGMKNQANTMACWTFATMESIESNLRLNQQGTYDLSEAHLELATQNNLFNSLVPFSRNFNYGGNYYISTAYLMNRIGPVSEDSVPFSIITDAVSGSRTPTLNDISDKDVEVVVNDVAIYMADQGACNNDSITSIKKYLVSNGAVGTSIYFEMYPKDAEFNGTTLVGKFLNGQYYYYDGSAYTNVEDVSVDANQTINHGVTIIGWDDTISKDNFSTKPSRDGAWLVKNSYGESLSISDGISIEMGNKGYYYISYDDINICTSVAGFYNIDTEVEDNVYYYDKLGGLGELPLNSSMDIYLANVFERSSVDSEMLEKVSFYNFESANRKYDIMYGTDLSNMSVIHSGIADHTGVVTVDIDPVNLTGEYFLIGIKFYQSSSIPVYFKYDGTFFEMDVPKNVSFISVDGKNWANYSDGTNDYLLPLRVYTTEADYTFGPGLYKITENNIEVRIDYDGISDLDNITYHIYDSNDTNYQNPLDDRFGIDNQIKTNKIVNVSLNDNSLVGSYRMVLAYYNTRLVTDFEVIEQNGNLIFKALDAPSEDDEPDFVVNDNPNNSDVTTPTPEEENISNNPKTGMLDAAIVVVILVLSIGMLVIYWFYNLRNVNNID